jgi:hypothetical protein
MTDIAENRFSNWFAPSRFAVLLALLVLASFPQVMLGVQTFIADFSPIPLPRFRSSAFGTVKFPFGTLTTTAAFPSWRNGTRCRCIRRR